MARELTILIERRGKPGIKANGTTSRPESRCRMGLWKASTAECAPLGDARIACRATDELLNETTFRSPVHARAVIADWATDDNTQRPHSALGDQTPADFSAALDHRNRPPRGTG